jgi:HlyD family secretion protein
MMHFPGLARITMTGTLLLLSGCSDNSQDIALGTLSRERIVLTATGNEIVMDLPVAEGEFVAAGTVLVKLDDTLQKASLEVALAQETRAQADLDKMETGPRKEEISIGEARVEGARAVYLEAEATVARSQKLIERGAVSQAQLEQEIARRNSARAELTSAEQALEELRSGSRDEDIRIARAKLAEAKARVKAERTRLNNLTIRASRNGLLDSLPWNLGERVPQGSPVAILLADERPFARIYVPETARARVKEGSAVSVKVDGIETRFDGKVRWISNDPSFTPYYALNQEQRSRLVYVAEIELPGDATELPSGIPVTAFLP